MTQDEIYQMVKQSELGFLLGDNWMLHHELEYFAKLVAQHERETCAKVVETLWDTPTNGMATEEQFYGNKCAKVIRARGKT